MAGISMRVWFAEEYLVLVNSSIVPSYPVQQLYFILPQPSILRSKAVTGARVEAPLLGYRKGYLSLRKWI